MRHGDAQNVLAHIKYVEYCDRTMELTEGGRKRLERAAKNGMDCWEFVDCAGREPRWRHMSQREKRRFLNRLEFLR